MVITEQVLKFCDHLATIGIHAHPVSNRADITINGVTIKHQVFKANGSLIKWLDRDNVTRTVAGANEFSGNYDEKAKQTLAYTVRQRLRQTVSLTLWGEGDTEEWVLFDNNLKNSDCRYLGKEWSVAYVEALAAAHTWADASGYPVVIIGHTPETIICPEFKPTPIPLSELFNDAPMYDDNPSIMSFCSEYKSPVLKGDGFIHLKFETVMHGDVQVGESCLVVYTPYAVASLTGGDICSVGYGVDNTQVITLPDKYEARPLLKEHSIVDYSVLVIGDVTRFNEAKTYWGTPPKV